MAFVGNIDMSVEQIVNSTEYDLFQPLPEQFDLAVMDRFRMLPTWLENAKEQQRTFY